ncbi:glycosyltransferase family 2 protein [Xanthomonas campestris pv. campestris]|uniref:Dolichyl-phosphate mannose synthase related protein n=1 Tax=Xanthomonas campestris pv. campestris (strain ATCC 33913 / DSM 3586 / NCPPB 528 / LMG 568 / P 25) TaxID=190485 RepID=Q8P3R9_XANCP|nr:glycosyltransferase family 2 protein [Xanthomonas campestris]AAM43221.1 dolichyl-phosphate mannose synthase related protein [Xanthomonas campestris pv. campestris str. ATCC 33913]AKS17918.1 dolichyl-phosphate mannose synthase [Xanthomonas campestris pv. campestris]AKS21931.1 dolichyl-phosphate mannose synthase [Xanthomonas campestris pv. campestris]ALE70484.1 dolichyl-phosphate mannose synthase [Xanthomonas campestris pv. campestris]MCC5047678.1 glycosyltransferase family 2 protein [Xanthom
MSRIPLSRDDTAILVPALNESLRIREVVNDALTYCSQVIVIDDGSDDGTADCIADLPVTLIRHPQRMGKGAALRSGFAEAQRQGMRAVMTMDGDGQHRAADFPRLLAAANRHPGAVIVGARMRKRATQPTIRRIGNDFGDWGIAWACGFRLVDSQSGQRLYPASVFTLPNVPGEGFVFEAQLLISAARQAGARVVAVPIETRYAGTSPGTFRKSHFRLVRDLWNITSHVVKQVWAYGHIWREYRRVRAHPVLIDDPDGEFATVPAVTKSNPST